MALSPLEGRSRSASPRPNPLQCPVRRWSGRPPMVTDCSESDHSGFRRAGGRRVAIGDQFAGFWSGWAWVCLETGVVGVGRLGVRVGRLEQWRVGSERRVAGAFGRGTGLRPRSARGGPRFGSRAAAGPAGPEGPRLGSRLPDSAGPGSARPGAGSAGLAWAGSTRDRPGLAGLGSTRSGPLGRARPGSARLGPARPGPARHGSARHGSTRPGWARSAPLGPARLGPAGPRLVRLGRAGLGSIRTPRPGLARLGSIRTPRSGSAQPDSAQVSSAWPGLARPGPARPGRSYLPVRASPPVPGRSSSGTSRAACRG